MEDGGPMILEQLAKFIALRLDNWPNYYGMISIDVFEASNIYNFLRL
jgi:hypothetical protein